jgi:hypothetical protein
MRLLFFSLLLFAFHSQANSQSLNSQDEAINALMDKHIALGKARNAMPGYRVQIFFGDTREDAIKQKTEFLKLFPNMGAYIVYQQLNFRLRVGDFKTKLQATEFLMQVRPLVPMSFLVKDNVKLPR